MPAVLDDNATKDFVLQSVRGSARIRKDEHFKTLSFCYNFHSAIKLSLQKAMSTFHTPYLIVTHSKRFADCKSFIRLPPCPFLASSLELTLLLEKARVKGLELLCLPFKNLLPLSVSAHAKGAHEIWENLCSACKMFAIKHDGAVVLGFLHVSHGMKEG